MKLFLVRHAHAVDGPDDSQRPLSDRGRKQARQMAEFLGAANSFAPTQIWHSGLVRARETAVELAAHACPYATVAALPGLSSDDAPDIIAAKAADLSTDTAVVGHEPHLSALASLLVCGAAEPARFVFAKGAALALERDSTGWAVRWFLSPDLLPRPSS